MMTPRRLVGWGSLMGALALVGCAATGYAQLIGERYNRVSADTYPVVVSHVDGQMAGVGPVQVPAGSRLVTVQGPPTVGQRYGSSQTLRLDLKPCTRYHLVAVKGNPAATEYSLRVEHEDRIETCAAGDTPPR